MDMFIKMYLLLTVRFEHYKSKQNLTVSELFRARNVLHLIACQTTKGAIFAAPNKYVGVVGKRPNNLYQFPGQGWEGCR
ncbi:Uncharacterised protein [Porphyromonas crevioricanis]|uniref:Uncharacterized protein n=1 Tax=Porphyromonas crevioricanis TaxID=393921 RepID=A0A2X4SU88_9PORP|nr:hypothetical protein SAMN02745203_00179 [Porphyromonas crevioricanis]SQH73381.1 Uncharacterised protein [Porphyromonas crevioricanis]